MKHIKVMTAHLQNINVWKASGKDWRALQSIRIKDQLRYTRVVTAEEIALGMQLKESKRKGWKSVIKDKRV